MDAGTLERQRPPLHGLVSARPARRPAPWLLPLAGVALLAGLAGGLLRAGVAIAPTSQAWLAQAALSHAALMICAFMGTVIGIERAIAVRHRAAWLAPLASAVAGPALLAGWSAIAACLLLVAALAFVGVHVLVLQRQRAPHSWLLLASALAWLVGNLLFALGHDSGRVLPWWFAFLVMTIAAERLEMTRLMRRRRAAQPLLVLVLATMAAGAGLSPTLVGGVLYGGSLFLLACWLFAFDIARRTMRADGLARYMAVCLLGGYGWLAIGGLAWAATAWGVPARDAALHALALGFIASMMMGHAPVVLPAIARVKLLFGGFFYLPLAALHLSLAARLGPGWMEPSWHARGSVLNALALALFAGTMFAAAIAWRRRHGGASKHP